MTAPVRILIVSFYAPPDLSAGSFRMGGLFDAFNRIEGTPLEIDVLTTMPNRYKAMAKEADEETLDGVVRIHRLRMPGHDSGMIGQSMSFAVFAWRAWRKSRGGTYDLVFATSSRLMTAALGALLSRRYRAPLYLDIRDLFTDTMKDVFRGSALRHGLPLFRWIEKQAFRRAGRINVVSPGFLPHIEAIAPGTPVRRFMNGIDPVFLETDFSKALRPAGTPPVILYAGNMGEGQGLHDIVPAAAARLGARASFRLIGGGGRRRQLAQALETASVGTVSLHDPVPRQTLLAEYRAADILFLHLNDHDAFLRVLPSKIFEYAATGKPILAGVSGYAAEFIRDHLPGAEVFDPCDADGMEAAFARLMAQDGAAPSRDAFRDEFARERIMDAMARDILGFIDGHQPGGS